MVYNTQNYMVFGLCPSSGILETRKQILFAENIGHWHSTESNVKGNSLEEEWSFFFSLPTNLSDNAKSKLRNERHYMR
jgi:hypothetical protein